MWMADYPDDPIGIVAEVLPELRKTLAGCAAFASHEALAAIFVDPRLQPWQARLPQVPSVEQRVNQVIALLHHEENEQGETALVLLLHILKPHEPTRRAALARLRHALQRGLSGEAVQAPLAGATPYLGLSTFQRGAARERARSPSCNGKRCVSATPRSGWWWKSYHGVPMRMTGGTPPKWRS
jgi:hypothetical protein